MANLTLDFSNEDILHPRGENTGFTFKDIGTDNFRYKVDSLTGQEEVFTSNSSNFDANAVKASLKNILHFKNGEEVLDPEFGISDIYEMIYLPFDKYTTQKMINTLKGIIAYYEPRIEIISIPTTFDEEKQEFLMTINYYIPKLQKEDNYMLVLNR